MAIKLSQNELQKVNKEQPERKPTLRKVETQEIPVRVVANETPARVTVSKAQTDTKLKKEYQWATDWMDKHPFRAWLLKMLIN